MLNRVEYSRYIERLDTEGYSELRERAPIDTYMRFASEFSKDFKEPIRFCKLFYRLRVEPQAYKGWQNRLDFEEPPLDLFKLVQHRQDNLLLEIKHIDHLFSIKTDIHRCL